MKAVALVYLLAVTSLFADSFDSEPLSTSDIATILELSASRSRVTFETAQELTLRYEYGGATQLIPLGKMKSLSVVIYKPSKVGGKDSQGVIIHKEDGGILSTYFGLPSSASQVGHITKTDFEHGVFSIVGSNKEDSSSYTFRLQILPTSQVTGK